MTKTFVIHAPIASCKLALKDGTTCSFINHKYYTQNAAHVAEIVKEYADQRFKDITDTAPEINENDPLEAIKSRARKELLEELARTGRLVTHPNRDMGASNNGPLRALNSNDGADMKAMSDGSVTLVPVAAAKALVVPAKA